MLPSPSAKCASYSLRDTSKPLSCGPVAPHARALHVAPRPRCSSLQPDGAAPAEDDDKNCNGDANILAPKVPTIVKALTKPPSPARHRLLTTTQPQNRKSFQ